MWLGGIGGVFLSDEQKTQLPSITKLGQQFKDFQDSPYRGEWDQKLRITAGEMRDLLLEIARLIERPPSPLEENEELLDLLTVQLAEDWSEEDGEVLWWRFPVCEPAHLGSPLYEDFPEDYYTHWTPVPKVYDAEGLPRWMTEGEEE